jgi:hypothetical protein
MIENLFSFPMILIYALFFGITEKIADLLDEHGLNWFKGSAIIFGLLFALFGSLLIFANNIIANVLLAMVLACLLRNRIDYLNHQITATIMLLSFIIFATFSFYVFSAFFIIALFFGALRDYIGDKIKKKNKLQKLYESIMWYYAIPALIYCIFFGDWVVFWAFFIYTIAYDGIKAIFRSKGID